MKIDLLDKIKFSGGEGTILNGQGEFSAISKPDYDENDETNSSFIKNRPFYDLRQRECLIPQQTVELEGGFGTLPYVELVEGDNYEVVFNGITYSCTCYTFTIDDVTFPCLGDIVGIITGSPTLPFAIVFIEGDTGIFADSTSVSIEVSQVTGFIKRIDEKYLPLDWIPKELGMKEVIPTTTFTEAFNQVDLGPVRLFPGCKVVVEYDGVTYNNCTVMNTSGADDPVFSIYTESFAASPFHIYTNYPSMGDLVYFGESGSHTLSLSVMEYSTVPNEYLDIDFPNRFKKITLIDDDTDEYNITAGMTALSVTRGTNKFAKLPVYPNTVGQLMTYDDESLGTKWNSYETVLYNMAVACGFEGDQDTFIKAFKDSMTLSTTQGAGYHNSIYRGKYLGTAVTDEQWAAIKAGTFDDLFIGDYWTIGDLNYRIAAFDYYYKTGDTYCTTHHVVIVPDTNMYAHCMNDTNVTTGAYVGSKMYTEGLNTAKTMINSAFGSDHILNHRQYLQNGTTSGHASEGRWYDSTVELMTEQNVYGCKIFGNCINGTAFPNNRTVDKSQYPLFAHRPDMISLSTGQMFLLRDVASDAHFCLVYYGGTAEYIYASWSSGVRPAFSICQL